jgi:tetratricopeptide (TPR) repeat protein
MQWFWRSWWVALLVCGVCTTGWAQGRYTPQGAAQRAYLNGESLREAGDALRARKDDKGAQRKYADAIEAFLDAKKADPAYIDVYVKLGLLYFTVGRSKDAIQVLEAGLQRDTDNLDLQFWYGQNLLAAGQAKKGVGVLDALAARTKRFPEVHLVLGEHHYKTKNYSAAAPALERYLKVKPDATAARARLGNTYFKLKLFEKALAAFTTVRAAWPDNVSVQVNIGNSHFGMRQYAKAIAELKAALAKEPNRPSALFNLAQSEFSLKNYAAAKGHYAAFVKQQPKNFNGRYFLGSTLMELGEDGPAIEQLSKAHQLRPDIVHPFYKIGLIHLRKQRGEAAEGAFQKARQIKPKDAWVLSGLGTVARQRGDLRKALALHSEAASLRPDEAKLQANLALTAAMQGALPTADKAITKALAGDTRDPWIRAAAARVLAQLAQPELDADPAKALGRLQQALTLKPDDPDLLAARALARLATGAKAEGLSDAQTAAQARPDDARLQGILGRALLANGKGADAVSKVRPLHEKAPSARTAGLLGAALIAAGQADAAIAVLDQDRAWRSAPAVSANRALARFARVLRDLPGGGAQRRVAKDLRVVLKVEKQLPPLLVARARYAAAINALRRGEGKEGRNHLGAATSWARKARTQNPEARHLRKGVPGGHFDYLIAYADVLQKRFDAVRTRLERKKGGLEKRLLRYVVGRIGASHFRQGNLNKARAAFDAAAKLGKDPIIEHNQQVVAWQQKRRKSALSVWRALQGKVPEALFNLGVAHEANGDQKAAWTAFRRYAETNRAQAAKAREIADVKQRIYRFEAAP